MLLGISIISEWYNVWDSLVSDERWETSALARLYLSMYLLDSIGHLC